MTRQDLELVKITVIEEDGTRYETTLAGYLQNPQVILPPDIVAKFICPNSGHVEIRHNRPYKFGQLAIKNLGQYGTLLPVMTLHADGDLRDMLIASMWDDCTGSLLSSDN